MWFRGEKNLHDALKWYRQAAEQGHEGAIQGVQRIEAEFSGRRSAVPRILNGPSRAQLDSARRQREREQRRY